MRDIIDSRPCNICKFKVAQNTGIFRNNLAVRSKMSEAEFNCQRHYRKTSDITKLLQDTTLSDSQSLSTSSQPNFIALSKTDLSTLRTLPSSASLVLFTPAIPSTSNIDPFEPLGKALSVYHRKVRHVPYLPSRGMTGTHETFCHHAASIIIVVCSIVNNSNVKGQQNFARAVVGLTLANATAILLVEVGDGGGDFEGFSTVLRCGDLGNATLERVADLILGPYS